MFQHSSQTPFLSRSSQLIQGTFTHNFQKYKKVKKNEEVVVPYIYLGNDDLVVVNMHNF
jgi:hypothetical protein